MKITIHGIKNCDTMAKARAWLDAHAIPHTFHDYKTQGIAESTLRAWVDKLGWEPLLNRAGTTFRKLPEPDRANLDEAKAIRLMLANPSMIKRPVLDIDGTLLVGFRPETYSARLAPQGSA
jgi:arsenate reductase